MKTLDENVLRDLLDKAYNRGRRDQFNLARSSEVFNEDDVNKIYNRQIEQESGTIDRIIKNL